MLKIIITSLTPLHEQFSNLVFYFNELMIGRFTLRSDQNYLRNMQQYFYVLRVIVCKVDFMFQSSK